MAITTSEIQAVMFSDTDYIPKTSMCCMIKRLFSSQACWILRELCAKKGKAIDVLILYLIMKVQNKWFATVMFERQ